MTNNFVLSCVDETNAANEFVALTALNAVAVELCTNEKKRLPSNADLTTYATFDQFKTLYAEANFITPLGDVSKTAYNANESGTVLTELVNNGGLCGVWFIAYSYFNEDGSRRSTAYGFAPANTVKYVAEELFNAGVKTVL